MNSVPLSYVTKLMQTYKIKYLKGFENNNVNLPMWKDLLKGNVAALVGTNNSYICKLVPLGGYATMAIDPSFNILNQYFMISDGAIMSLPWADITAAITFIPPIIPVFPSLPGGTSFSPFVKPALSAVAGGVGGGIVAVGGGVTETAETTTTTGPVGGGVGTPGPGGGGFGGGGFY